MTSELNKVDRHIKQMMLQYPSLFPSRIKCLSHLFLTNGNGYRWDEQGCLVSYDNDQPVDKINYNDLDYLKEQRNKHRSSPFVITDYYQFLDVESEQERLVRQFRETHIDLFCRFHKIGEDFTYSDLNHFSVQWSAFRDAPYGNIDPDWEEVMKETIHMIKYAFNLIWYLHRDKPLGREKMPEPSMFSTMPERFQKMYNDILEVERKLTVTE